MRLLLWLALACALAAVAADDPDAERLPAGPGKEVVVRVCSECHGMDNIRKKRLSEDDWGTTVSQMVDEGAQVSGDDVTVIVEYLGKNFGPDSKVWVNTAPLAELKSVLGFTNDEANAILAWRAEKGDFKSAADVQKVPGVDAGKVEAQKGKMTF